MVALLQPRGAVPRWRAIRSAPRRCSTKPSASRRRARRTPCSTSGSAMRPTATSSAPSAWSCAPATAARTGRRGCTRSTTPRACTCTRCAASAPMSTWPASRACCSSSTQATSAFARSTSPYKGTLFGVAGNAQALVAYGLRGTVLRSTDGGRSWQQTAHGPAGRPDGRHPGGDGPHRARQPGRPRARQHRRRRELHARHHRTHRARCRGGGTRRGTLVVAGPRGAQAAAAALKRAAGEPHAHRHDRADAGRAGLARPVRPPLRLAPGAARLQPPPAWSSSSAPCSRWCWAGSRHEADAERQLREDDPAAAIPTSRTTWSNQRGPARPGQRAAHRGGEHAKGDIYDPQYLDALKKINDELFLTPGVDRAWMKSLWTPAVRWTEVTEEGFRGGPVMPDNYDGSPAPPSSCAPTSRAPAWSAAWWATTSSPA